MFAKPSPHATLIHPIPLASRSSNTIDDSPGVSVIVPWRLGTFPPDLEVNKRVETVFTEWSELARGPDMASAPFGTVLRHLFQRIGVASAGDSSATGLLGRFAANRDEAAFAELVRRHGPMVLGVCQRVLHHPDDAEDAFQATFLVLARKAATLDRVGPCPAGSLRWRATCP